MKLTLFLITVILSLFYLGKDMNPNNIMRMISVIKDSKIDLEQLKPLQELIKK